MERVTLKQLLQLSKEDLKQASLVTDTVVNALDDYFTLRFDNLMNKYN